MIKVQFKDRLAREESLSKGYFRNTKWIKQGINWRPEDQRGGYRLMQAKQS